MSSTDYAYQLIKVHGFEVTVRASRSEIKGTNNQNRSLSSLYSSSSLTYKHESSPQAHLRLGRSFRVIADYQDCWTCVSLLWIRFNCADGYLDRPFLIQTSPSNSDLLKVLSLHFALLHSCLPVSNRLLWIYQICLARKLVLWAPLLSRQYSPSCREQSMFLLPLPRYPNLRHFLLRTLLLCLPIPYSNTSRRVRQGQKPHMHWAIYSRHWTPCPQSPLTSTSRQARISNECLDVIYVNKY